MQEKEKRIVVHTPQENQVVGQTVTVSGVCDTYEGTVHFRIRDPGGDILATGHASGGTLGRKQPFEAELLLTKKPATFEGVLEAFEVDMKDGSERETVTVRIRFC